MDYDQIADVVSGIKFHYVKTREWDQKLCDKLLKLTQIVPLMVCRKRGIRDDDQPDLIQKAYQEVFRNFHSIKDDRAFPRYLFITIDHLCQRYWRKKYVSVELTGSDDFVISEATYRLDKDKQSDLFIREDLRDAMKQIPRNYRDVIELYFFAGMTAKEISKRLKTNMNTITSRLRRGRIMLREILEGNSI
ncbi:sigma-70 family RNA polymerase sigma factor [bacterium]|nr:sigma-70 family RNA polymerase sigma factor [candidate division CSSED10-310 bacterium]